MTMRGIYGLQPAVSVFIRNVSSKVRWDTFQGTAIDAILKGEEVDLTESTFVYELDAWRRCREWNCIFKRRCGYINESELLSAEMQIDGVQVAVVYPI